MRGEDRLFMDVAQLMAKRSTCLRGNIGAVLVQDRRIVSTGYNGSPPGMPHCVQSGCEPVPSDDLPWSDPDQLLTLFGCQRTIHAEANALAWAARKGVRTEGAIMYCTHAPCHACAKLIVAAGILHVVYEVPYRLTAGVDLLDAASVPAERISAGLQTQVIGDMQVRIHPVVDTGPSDPIRGGFIPPGESSGWGRNLT